MDLALDFCRSTVCSWEEDAGHHVFLRACACPGRIFERQCARSWFWTQCPAFIVSRIANQPTSWMQPKSRQTVRVGLLLRLNRADAVTKRNPLKAYPSLMTCSLSSKERRAAEGTFGSFLYPSVIGLANASVFGVAADDQTMTSAASGSAGT